MSNIDRQIDQAFSDLKATCGGVKNDYFGLIYLEKEMKVPREKAINQVAFGGCDYGIDGFHYDREKRNLYIFQFKYTKSHAPFKESLQRLIDKGIEVAFVTPNSDSSKNQVINQLWSCMIDNRAIIDQVFIRFIFLGDPSVAENSPVLDKLREDLENKKYLVDKFFKEKQVKLYVDYQSYSGKVTPPQLPPKTHSYDFPIKEMFSQKGPYGESMQVCLIRLMDLYRVYKDMGNGLHPVL